MVSPAVSISTTNLHDLPYATATVNRWAASHRKAMAGVSRKLEKLVTRPGFDLNIYVALRHLDLTILFSGKVAA